MLLVQLKLRLSVAGFGVDVEHAKVGTDSSTRNKSLQELFFLLLTLMALQVVVGLFLLTVDQNAARDAFEDGTMGGSVSTSVAGIGTVKAEVSNSKTRS